MTDAEFAEELVERLNLVLQADSGRANIALGQRLALAGYASVAHFIGQLAMPRGITRKASADDVMGVKFVAPVVKDQEIIRFEAVTGEELQRRHAESAARAEVNSKE